MCKAMKYQMLCVFVFQVKIYAMRFSTYDVNQSNLRNVSIMFYGPKKIYVCICYKAFLCASYPLHQRHFLLIIHIFCTRSTTHCSVCVYVVENGVFTSYSTSVIFRNALETWCNPRAQWRLFHSSEKQIMLLQFQVARTHLQNVCFKMRPRGKTRALNTEIITIKWLSTCRNIVDKMYSSGFHFRL